MTSTEKKKDVLRGMCRREEVRKVVPDEDEKKIRSAYRERLYIGLE